VSLIILIPPFKERLLVHRKDSGTYDSVALILLPTPIIIKKNHLESFCVANGETGSSGI
jgi:hypothetical protein